MDRTQTQTLLDTGAQAAVELAAYITERAPYLTLLAVHRARTIGADTYGNASYDKTYGELMGELDDELADAIFYQHIATQKRIHRTP